MVRTMHFTLLLAAALPLFAHDWLIVPGERVGPVTSRSTEASLRTAFAGAAVMQAKIQIDKTTTAPGVEIYRGRPGESLAVVWRRKDRGLWWPLLVIPCYGSTGTECRWRTAAGVRIGLSLADLEKLNEKPFLLYQPHNRQAWSEPWWNEGKLAGQLGEDVELSFDDPDSVDDISSAYLTSNQKPLTDRVLRLTRLSVFLLSHQRSTPANDWTVVPGERLGPIPMGAAAEPLRETLSAAEVHRVVSNADEGMGDIPGISIFGGHTGREVLLRRDGTLICGGYSNYRTCKWRIAGGIPLTTTVEALERLNGRPFVFNGCCFDLGGIIISWEGGKLATLHGARFAVGCEGDQPQRLMGEVSLRSDDPDIRQQKCTVDVINF